MDQIWLTGDKLPPATNVLASGKTDADGLFVFKDVPRHLYRLVIEDKTAGRGTLELGSIRFPDAAQYIATATIHTSGRRRLMYLSRRPAAGNVDERMKRMTVDYRIRGHPLHPRLFEKK